MRKKYADKMENNTEEEQIYVPKGFLRRLGEKIYEKLYWVPPVGTPIGAVAVAEYGVVELSKYYNIDSTSSAILALCAGLEAGIASLWASYKLIK